MPSLGTGVLRASPSPGRARAVGVSLAAEPGSQGVGDHAKLGAVPYSWHRVSAAASTGECGSVPGSGWQTCAGANAVSVGNVSNRNL